jgi:chromosomal replication initiation ATPase DnaA
MVIVERDNPEFRRVVFAMDETFGNAARSIARFSEGWLKAACSNDPKVKSRWLVLAGSPGCGKTHALQAAYRFLRAHAIDCWPRWYTTPPSVTKFTWSRVVGLEPGAWEDIEAEANRATMVLIDDLGSEVDRYKTGEPTERLRRIMEICKGKWLLVTTNVPKAKFSTVFDGRVASRLELAVVLDLAGALDYRARTK